MVPRNHSHLMSFSAADSALQWHAIPREQLRGELRYVAHSGWGNQWKQLLAARCLAAYLKRTLLWPVVMQHYDVSLGARFSKGCPIHEATWMLQKYAAHALPKRRPSLHDILVDPSEVGGPTQTWWTSPSFSCTNNAGCTLVPTACNQTTHSARALLTVSAHTLVLGSAFTWDTFYSEQRCDTLAFPRYHPLIVKSLLRLVHRTVEPHSMERASPEPLRYDAIHLRLTERRATTWSAGRLQSWLVNAAPTVYVATDDEPAALALLRNASVLPYSNRSSTEANFSSLLRFITVKQLGATGATVFGHLAPPQRNVAAFMVPIVADILACVHAQRFLPSPGSTLSSHIKQLRSSSFGTDGTN